MQKKLHALLTPTMFMSDMLTDTMSVRHLCLLVAKGSSLPEKALNLQQLDVLQELTPSTGQES